MTIVCLWNFTMDLLTIKSKASFRPSSKNSAASKAKIIHLKQMDRLLKKFAKNLLFLARLMQMTVQQTILVLITTDVLIMQLNIKNSTSIANSFGGSFSYYLPLFPCGRQRLHYTLQVPHHEHFSHIFILFKQRLGSVTSYPWMTECQFWR